MDYQLRVATTSSAPHTIRLEAASVEQARIEAEKQGFIVLAVKTRGLKLNRQKFPLLLFCQELTVLLQSGLLLTQSLETLSQKEKNQEIRSVIAQLVETVRAGHSFSDSLAAQPGHFPSLFVAMVRACETTGNLSEGLSRFAHYLEQIDVLKKRLISASIYPALILSFGLLVMLFLLGYVVPRFSQIYESRGTDLSYASEVLLLIGSTVEAHGTALLLGLISVIAFATFFFTRHTVRARIGEILTHMPILGERIRVYHLSRFYRTFAMLLRSGIPVVSALTMVSELLGLTVKIHVEKARKMILDGQTFAQAMQQAELVTPVAVQLFRVGENAGNLDQMMERAASFHEDEMMRWVDAFSKLVEPALMALLGVVIGLIVFLMYLPIFELASGL
jgi:general secretion pathway protein F